MKSMLCQTILHVVMTVKLLIVAILKDMMWCGWRLPSTSAAVDLNSCLCISWSELRSDICKLLFFNSQGVHDDSQAPDVTHLGVHVLGVEHLRCHVVEGATSADHVIIW